MPIISRNVPAFASASVYPPSWANDADYTTHWVSNGPAWLAYDLSAVPSLQRGQVIVAWYNDPITTAYDHTLIGDNAYDNVGSYTIQLNAAPGGSGPPSSGWMTVATVSGNVYHSRQHLIQMGGFNWIRLNVSGIDSCCEQNALLNMDVHDASQGASDDWIFYGDSITQAAMAHQPVPLGTTGPNFSQMINSARPSYFPAFEDAGTGYLVSGNGASHIDQWLGTFPGRYVGLAYGTNDANSCLSPESFYNNYVTMVQAVIAAGKVPIVPTIPWARTANVQNCGPGLNAKIQQLYSDYPQVIRGPDLWAFFNTHQNLISPDDLHPTDAGYTAYRQLWADVVIANVYG